MQGGRAELEFLLTQKTNCGCCCCELFLGSGESSSDTATQIILLPASPSLRREDGEEEAAGVITHPSACHLSSGPAHKIEISLSPPWTPPPSSVSLLQQQPLSPQLLNHPRGEGTGGGGGSMKRSSTESSGLSLGAASAEEAWSESGNVEYT